MTKLHKVELYILDFYDEVRGEELKTVINSGFLNSSVAPFLVQTVDIPDTKDGEFDDSLDINQINANVETYRKYFKED